MRGRGRQALLATTLLVGHQADCLIAAAAVGVGATLATANVDDSPMQELSRRALAVSI